MKRKNIWLIILSSIVSVALISSCKKERAPEKSVQTEYTSLDDFYNQNQPPEQSFVIDSTGHDSITGQQGTKIWRIPKEIFMYKSTHQDIQYPYILKLIEVYSIKDMILVKYPSVANTNILHTGGELKVTAFKDDQELVLKEHCGYRMLALAPTPVSGMGVYYGFTTGTTTDWNNNVLNTDYLFTNDTVTHLTNQANGYNMQICKLGWVNIAKLTNNNNFTNITLTAGGTNTNLIDVFIIFNNLHSYIKVNSLAASGLPVGEPITIFAMGKDSNGSMFYFKENYTVSSNMNVTLTFQTSTAANVLTVMGTL
jgi:hypothetical protein